MASEIEVEEMAEQSCEDIAESSVKDKVKTEAMIEAAKAMMGTEFQKVLTSLVAMMPGYEEMLVS